MRLTRAAGTNRSRMSKLPRMGKFRLVVVATDAAGNVSKKLTAR